MSTFEPACGKQSGRVNTTAVCGAGQFRCSPCFYDLTEAAAHVPGSDQANEHNRVGDHAKPFEKLNGCVPEKDNHQCLAFR